MRGKLVVARTADVQTKRSLSDSAACAIVQMVSNEPHPYAMSLLLRSMAPTMRQTARGTKGFAIPISSSIQHAKMVCHMSEDVG